MVHVCGLSSCHFQFCCFRFLARLARKKRFWQLVFQFCCFRFPYSLQETASILQRRLSILLFQIPEADEGPRGLRRRIPFQFCCFRFLALYASPSPWQCLRSPFNSVVLDSAVARKPRYLPNIFAAFNSVVLDSRRQVRRKTQRFTASLSILLFQIHTIEKQHLELKLLFDLSILLFQILAQHVWYHVQLLVGYVLSILLFQIPTAESLTQDCSARRY